jgi:hypothetical protein
MSPIDAPARTARPGAAETVLTIPSIGARIVVTRALITASRLTRTITC